MTRFTWVEDGGVYAVRDVLAGPGRRFLSICGGGERFSTAFFKYLETASVTPSIKSVPLYELGFRYVQLILA